MIQLHNTKTSKVSFTMSVTGVNQDTLQSRFIIDTPVGLLGFTCEKSSVEHQWSVSVPSLMFIPVGEYKCWVEVVVDNYYFKPFESAVNITSPPSVTIVTPTTDVQVPTQPTIAMGDMAVEVDETEPQVVPVVESKTTPKPAIKDSKLSLASMVVAQAAAATKETKRKRINDDILKQLKNK